jgi:hypothetical protein
MKRVLWCVWIVALLHISAPRSPAPIQEETTPTPAPAPVEQKPAPEQPLKPRHKKADTEVKTTKETTKTAKPPVSAAATIHSFAGTWKGPMTDGNFTIVINPDETSVIAYGPSGTGTGTAHVSGNTISWSTFGQRQKVSWSMRLLSGGRRAEVTAFHVSGNVTGTLDKTN